MVRGESVRSWWWALELRVAMAGFGVEDLGNFGQKAVTQFPRATSDRMELADAPTPKGIDGSDLAG